MDELERAKELIREFYRREYLEKDPEKSFDDLSCVPLAYTEFGSMDEYPVQVFADLVGCRLLYAEPDYVAGWHILKEESFKDLADMNERAFEYLSFDELVSEFYEFFSEDDVS